MAASNAGHVGVGSWLMARDATENASPVSSMRSRMAFFWKLLVVIIIVLFGKSAYVQLPLSDDS